MQKKKSNCNKKKHIENFNGMSGIFDIPYPFYMPYTLDEHNNYIKRRKINLYAMVFFYISVFLLLTIYVLPPIWNNVLVDFNLFTFVKFNSVQKYDILLICLFIFIITSLVTAGFFIIGYFLRLKYHNYLLNDLPNNNYSPNNSSYESRINSLQNDIDKLNKDIAKDSFGFTSGLSTRIKILRNSRQSKGGEANGMAMPGFGKKVD